MPRGSEQILVNDRNVDIKTEHSLCLEAPTTRSVRISRQKILAGGLGQVDHEHVAKYF